jgi:RimJ/RimL family protein N-acetyltransferase
VTEPKDPSEAVLLRKVTDGDLSILFEHQLDPEAVRMAAFPSREREAFMTHWANILGDPAVEARAIVFEGRVAGNIVSWEQDGAREVGYWIGREHWGKGVATEALRQFLPLDPTRPLFAHVARQNVASIRVLEKCGFATLDDAAGPRREDGVDEIVMRLDG